MESEVATDESVCAAVVRAVSAVVGLEPCSLQPLSDVVDPDALDALFAPLPNGERRPSGRLSFVYSGCRVTVESGEEPRIHLLEDDAELPPQIGSDHGVLADREPSGAGRR